MRYIACQKASFIRSIDRSLRERKNGRKKKKKIDVFNYGESEKKNTKMKIKKEGEEKKRT